MLSDLPFEILTEIAYHLPTASSLRALSLTSQRLHDFVEKDGLRVFVQTRFPSIETSPLWKDAAQALTSTSKAWDRRAFVARELLPMNKERPRRRNGHRQNGQTMGYIPVIDSYESSEGTEWKDKKEVLVWGAGAELIMRIKRPQRCSDKNQEPKSPKWDNRAVNWQSLKAQGSLDGVDDITSIDLFRPHQQAGRKDEERFIVGRANGQLDLTVFKDEAQTLTHTATYFTASKPVRSAHLNTEERPLLAAAVSDLGLLIYNTHDLEGLVDPVAGITISAFAEKGRTWTTKFLSSNKLAVGLGPTKHPLHIYQVTPSNICTEPLRKFTAEWSTPFLSRTGLAESTSSVYAIAPLPASTQAGGSPGDLLLSGWYNSNIKLHDLRSPSSAVALFQDTVDSSPIYSLLSLGRERFLAGAGRDAIVKLFDLRLPGGRNYSYQALTNPEPPHADSNLFVRADPSRTGISPPYALSSPSPTSPSIYVGLESTVVSLDLTTTEEITRQPVLRSSLYHESKSQTIRLAGYARPNSSTEGVRLLAQEDVRRYLEPTGNFAARYAPRVSLNECVKGWDCRWRPTGDDGWGEQRVNVDSWTGRGFRR